MEDNIEIVQYKKILAANKASYANFSATLHPDNGWCVMNVCPTTPKTQVLIFCVEFWELSCPIFTRDLATAEKKINVVINLKKCTK